MSEHIRRTVFGAALLGIGCLVLKLLIVYPVVFKAIFILTMSWLIGLCAQQAVASWRAKRNG
jgi:hypothetical protein